MTTKTTLAPLLGLCFGLLSFVGLAAAADAPPAAPGKPVIDATTAPKLPARAKIDWEKMNESQRKKYMKATVLPEMKKQPLKMSSILLASARQPSKEQSPLVRNGEEYVPNISHVFRQDQHLYLLYEVYQPTRAKPAEGQAKNTKPGIDLLSSLELIQGSTKVYETPLVKATAVNVEGRDAVSVELDVPLAGLKPGQYICQLNVIDDAAGSFAFPRFAVLVRQPAAQPALAASSGSGGR